MQLEKSKIRSFVFYVLIIFCVFDGVRSNLIFSSLVSPLRELFIIFFIALSFKFAKDCRRSDLILAVPFLLISAMAIVNIPITLSIELSDYKLGPLSIFENKYSAVYKHVFFSIIFISMLCYQRNNEHVIDKSLKLFVNCAAIYSLVTIPIYLYGFPLFVDNFRDWGRMGIGYPTMDGQMICFAMIALIFSNTEKSFLYFNLKLACLLIGILAQNTGTAMASVSVIALLCLIKMPRKTIKYFMFGIPIIAVGLSYQYFRNPDFFANMLYIFVNKFSQLFGLSSGVNADFNTLAIRDFQYSRLDIILSTDPLVRLFGLGGQVYIENEFKLMLAGYGVFAFAFFLLSFVWMSIYVLASKNRNKLILMSIIVLWGFSSYTLASIHLFTTSFSFCLVFSYFYVQGGRSRAHVEEAQGA